MNYEPLIRNAQHVGIFVSTIKTNGYSTHWLEKDLTRSKVGQSMYRSLKCPSKKCKGWIPLPDQKKATPKFRVRCPEGHMVTCYLCLTCMGTEYIGEDKCSKCYGGMSVGSVDKIKKEVEILRL